MRRFLPLMLLAFLPLAGCDTADGGNVFLSPRDVSFSFQTSGGSLSVGQPATVSSTGSVSLQGRLDGFSLGEIVAARVTGARIRRLSPLGESLGTLIQSAQVSVVAGSAQQVASGSGFNTTTPSAPTDLTTTGADVASILRQAEFSGRMALTPAKAVDGIYEVTLTLAIEVEGL